MELSEMKEFVKKIEQLTVENSKLENLKVKYVEISQSVINIGHKLKGVSDELLLIAEVIDPLNVVKTSRSGRVGVKSGVYTELVRKLYDEALSGKQFTTLSLDQYGEFDQQQKHHIMRALLKMHGMTKVKDGGRIRIYFSDGKSPSVT